MGPRAIGEARIKRRFSAQHRAAPTVVCVGLLQPGWLVQIEAVAAAD